MARKAPEGFVIFYDHMHLTERLTDAERGRLLLAVGRYAQYGEQPQNFEGTLSVLFDLMRSVVDKKAMEYQKTCERNAANSAKRDCVRRRQEESESQYPPISTDDHGHPPISTVNDRYPPTSKLTNRTEKNRTEKNRKETNRKETNRKEKRAWEEDDFDPFTDTIEL